MILKIFQNKLFLLKKLIEAENEEVADQVRVEIELGLFSMSRRREFIPKLTAPVFPQFISLYFFIL